MNTASKRKSPKIFTPTKHHAAIGERQFSVRHYLTHLLANCQGPVIAATDMEKIKAAGLEKIRFGWAGGTKPGDAYYYRIQGPTFLMEAANTQNDANHLHATWRDFTGDFGHDLLGEHFSGDH